MVPVPLAQERVGCLVPGIEIGVACRNDQVAGQVRHDLPLHAGRVDVVDVAVEEEQAVQAGIERPVDLERSQESLQLLRRRGPADQVGLDEVLDVVPEVGAAEPQPIQLVVEARLHGRGRFGSQIGIADDLVEMGDVLETEVQLAEIGSPEALAPGGPQAQRGRGAEEQPGARHERRAVPGVIVQPAPDRQAEPGVRLDPVVEPRIGHADLLARVVAEQPVVAAVLVPGPFGADLQELARADDLGQAGLQPVQPLVQIGSLVDDSRFAQEIDRGTLVVLAVVGSRLQLRAGRQARVERGAVVLGAVVGHGLGRPPFAD